MDQERLITAAYLFLIIGSMITLIGALVVYFSKKKK